VATLRHSDLQGVLGFLQQAGAETGPDPFPAPVLDLLRTLVPSEAVSWHEWTLDGGRSRYAVASVDPARTATVWEAYTEFRHQDPLPGGGPWPSRPPALVGRTLKMSDLLSDRRFRRLDLYNYVCKPLGIQHVMKLFLPLRGGLARSLVFDRGGRNFSERDRLVVDVLQPHLVQLEERAKTRRLAAALAAGSELPGELIVLDGANRIELATTRARRLLHRYAPGREGARLPPIVEDWLREDAGRLVLERGANRLVIRRVNAPELTLVLTEEPVRKPMTGILTPREQEILALVADGKSNAEIAAYLWIALGTVRAHLEHIYAKLGVRSRTAALARARRLNGDESD
jgi:DNA-binding CsgD family transcriptional regulator